MIGAGISGLAAAEAARALAGRVADGLEISVLEREPEVGGKALSLRRNGWLVEAGPTGFMESEPALDQLIASAGLGARGIESGAAAQRRFVWQRGKLRQIEPKPGMLLSQGILSPFGLLRLGCERFVKVRRDASEESVLAFARRRIGAQAAERLVVPLVQGIFAGDPARLSLQAAFPRMNDMEQRYGGLLKAMGKLKAQGRGGPGSKPLRSFEGGLQSLALALGQRQGASLRTQAAARAIARDGSRWRVALESGEELVGDALVLACEAFAAAELLRPALPELAGELAAIPYPPAAVVALGFGPQELERVPLGFGAIVSKGGGVRSLGILWETHIFAGRAPERHLLVRCILGGRLDEAIGGMSREELVRLARADLERVHGITAEPLHVELALWPRAIPQYELGHVARSQRIEAAVERAFGLYLAGNYLEGVAYPRAAARGFAAGEQAARFLAGR